MPRRALIERRPWLLASMALALAYALLQGSSVPGLYLAILAALPLVLLAAYSAMRHRGGDTRSLAVILGLQAAGWALGPLAPVVAINLLLLGYVLGIGLFLGHRQSLVDGAHKAGALALTLLTPALCYFAASRAGTGAPLFFGLALGGMAASSWVSTFPRERVGVGAVLIVFGNVLALAAGDTGLVNPIAYAAWPLFYVGNLVLATGVTGELRMRAQAGLG